MDVHRMQAAGLAWRGLRCFTWAWTTLGRHPCSPVIQKESLHKNNPIILLVFLVSAILKQHEARNAGLNNRVF